MYIDKLMCGQVLGFHSHSDCSRWFSNAFGGVNAGLIQTGVIVKRCEYLFHVSSTRCIFLFLRRFGCLSGLKFKDAKKACVCSELQAGPECVACRISHYDIHRLLSA